MANYNQFALFAAKRPSIGNIVLNCTLSERHGRRYAISESPIENGATITDHALKLPRVLDLVGVLSPYPDNIQQALANKASAFVGQNGFPDARGTWARIVALADSRIPFDVYTNLELYRNMMFESFEHTEDDQTSGSIITLVATLRQVQFAATISELNIADSVLNNLSSADDVGLQGTSPL